jgi:hypothetical protein
MKVKIKSEEEVNDEARMRFRAMMARMTLFERGEPLLKEMKWVLKGRENEAEHQMILPDYCYNSFNLLKRTLFNVVPTYAEIITIADKDAAATAISIEDAKQCISFDWEKFGAVIGMGVRCFRFLELEAKAKLKQEGLSDLDENQAADLAKWLFSWDWVEEKVAALEEYSKAAIPKWNEAAYQWGPEAMTLLNQGIARGTSGLLDEAGAPVGEGKLKLIHTHVFLLIAWPEIEEMISADPPKSRNDLWDWLTPFSDDNWIEIKDLEQLNRLCDSIKLKLKKPGAPRKEK